MTWNITTQLSGVAADRIAAPQTLTQWTPSDRIDLTEFTEPGDALYSIDLPEGMGLMTLAHVIFGAPHNQQAATVHNIYCKRPLKQDFWIRITIEVGAVPGNVYDVSTWTEIRAIPEYARGYSGPGALVRLAANAVIDMDDVTWDGNDDRCVGLTSQLVFISADFDQPAEWTGTEALQVSSSSGSYTSVGNISFVHLKHHRDQPGSPIPVTENPGGSPVVGNSGNTKTIAVALINCEVSSDVPLAETRQDIKAEMVGFSMTADAERIVVYGNTFRNVFNGVTAVGETVYVANNTQVDSWGDMIRGGTTTGSPTGLYHLFESNHIYDTASDGFVRHADGVQFGGGGAANGTVRYVERRGDLSFQGTKNREFSAVSPNFNRPPPGLLPGDFYDGAVSQTASSEDRSMYRMRTDTAASNLTVTLPDIATVAEGFEACVQKFSGDETYDVIVDRNGANINGAAANHTISGSWRADRIWKKDGQWLTSTFGTGIQHGLYQSTAGLDLMQDFYQWATGTTSGPSAGLSIEARSVNAKAEQLSFARLIATDIDGDGEITANDGSGIGPQVMLRHAGAEISDLFVTRTAAPSIVTTDGATGTLTGANNDTSQNPGNDATTQSLFMGEGAQPSSPEEQVWELQHKPDGNLAGTDIGMVGFGPATHGYDFVNNRTRIPGYIECTGPTVIELSGTTYQIATAATFDRAGTGARQYQWCCNHLPIAGQTGATLTQANAPAGWITCREIIPDAIHGDCITESNRIAEA